MTKGDKKICLNKAESELYVICDVQNSGASLNDYSDAYVFSRQDVQYIEWAYESNEQRPKMSSFSFNLSDIAAGTKQISDDGSLVWSDQVIPY